MAYAQAYLKKGHTEFESDFLTVNPLMGDDCLQPFVDVALENNKGIFILLETSNNGADMILKETTQDSRQINEKIADFIQYNYQSIQCNSNELGPIGCVIGATNTMLGIGEKASSKPIFMPGIGAQSEVGIALNPV